jgi:hypothetical protein
MDEAERQIIDRACLTKYTISLTWKKEIFFQGATLQSNT